MEKLKVTIEAPNTRSEINEDMLNELASIFWCDPQEVTVTVKVIDNREESNNETYLVRM
jgi:hypothetical protein